MAIIFKGSVNDIPAPKQPIKDAPKPLSFNELRSLHAVKEQPQETVVAKVVTKPTKPQQTDNSNLIKPKYMEDKSVYYKSSGYLKDLLGEGN